jgi:CO dehydrogenase/acetyl-CoA synthase epsilon subunit
MKRRQVRLLDSDEDEDYCVDELKENEVKMKEKSRTATIATAPSSSSRISQRDSSMSVMHALGKLYHSKLGAYS